MNTSSPDVLALGDVLYDYQYWIESLPQVGDEAQILLANQGIGGSATNTAITLRAQDISCALSARIGEDQLGAEIYQDLARTGLDLSCLQYGGKTGYTVTMIDQAGERTMFSYRGASAEALKWTVELRAVLQQIKLLVLSGYYLLTNEQANFALQAAKLVKEAGGMLALDPSPTISLVEESIQEKILALTDVLLPNQRELELMAGTTNLEEGLGFLLTKVPAIALKLGSQGSLLALTEGFRLPQGNFTSQAQRFQLEAIPKKAIDTTGAGDSFNAGFIASYLKGEEPTAWLRTGNELAAKVISTKGANSVFMKDFAQEYRRETQLREP